MRRLIPLIVVVLLIAALVFVNHSIGNNARPDKDDDDAQPQMAQKADTPKSAPVAPAGAGTDLLPEVTINDPAKAKYKVTVGWVYDEASVANPQPLILALQTVQKAAQESGGTISAEIVDLDVPAGDLSPAATAVAGLGIALNGNAIGPSVNPGGNGLTADAVARSLPPPPHL